MDFTQLWYSMSIGMSVGTVYGLLFTILQTRVHLFKTKLFVLGVPLFRLLCFLGLHYVMRHILAELDPVVYAITLFIFFIVSVQLLYGYFNKEFSTY